METLCILFETSSYSFVNLLRNIENKMKIGQKINGDTSNTKRFLLNQGLKLRISGLTEGRAYFIAKS